MCSVIFKQPAVKPVTQKQQEAFDRLEELKNGDLSRMFVWIIKQRNYLSDKQSLNNMKKSLRHKFSGQTLDNWSLLLVCVSKVINLYIHYIYI